MKFFMCFYAVMLAYSPFFLPGLRNGNAFTEARPCCERNQEPAPEHSDERPARTVNSTREDALVLDAALEGLLNFPALRANLPEQSHATKMIFYISNFPEGFLHVFGKNNKHPEAVFMDAQFQKQVPEDVLNDLDHRNAGVASWSKYKPGSPNIVVMRDDEFSKTYGDDPFMINSEWYRKNPDYAGAISASLPGYSRRKSTAVLRFSYSPAPFHICLGSCLLVKVYRKWVVQRIETTDIL